VGCGESTVRSIESGEGVLIFDDTIQEKAWTDESDLMCWHHDHLSRRNVRGDQLAHHIEQSKPVMVVLENRLTPVAKAGDVIDGTGKFNTKLSGHGRRLKGVWAKG